MPGWADYQKVTGVFFAKFRYIIDVYQSIFATYVQAFYVIIFMLLWAHLFLKFSVTTPNFRIQFSLKFIDSYVRFSSGMIYIMSFLACLLGLEFLKYKTAVYRYCSSWNALEYMEHGYVQLAIRFRLLLMDCVFTELSLVFFLLLGTLFPIVHYLFSQDSDKLDQISTFFMYTVFLLSYLLLIIDNIYTFYIYYELIILLLFGVLYLSSNSRGGVEAALFYTGWAVLGSVLVGVGIILLAGIANTQSFYLIMSTVKLTTWEVYIIYILLFFGFGVKLSVWPFWYWLPKAHVEVSTGISIFLSCILIKLSFFSLLRFKCIFPAEFSYNLFAAIVVLSVYDVASRVSNVRDLKALVAYGSVLHTNLLVLLVHLDNTLFFKGIALYIVGHSYSTTVLFLSVNLIETHYGSRNIVAVTGLWQTSPFLSKLIILAIFSFLDIPLSSFYWAEFWLWLVVYQSLHLTVIYLLFLCCFLFVFLFFKIWWGVLSGTPSNKTSIKIPTSYKTMYLILITLLLVLTACSIQPTLIYTLGSFL
jgi:NADH:ubiquinone oxidoreductase subunit 4 (subunit M)